MRDLTDDEIAALERLCEAATPEHLWRLYGCSVKIGEHITYSGYFGTEENASLAYAARTALPRLIAEVKRHRSG